MWQLVDTIRIPVYFELVVSYLNTFKDDEKETHITETATDVHVVVVVFGAVTTGFADDNTDRKDCSAVVKVGVVGLAVVGTIGHFYSYGSTYGNNMRPYYGFFVNSDIDEFHHNSVR